MYFSGHQCETEIDECNSDPCQNDANCEDLLNSYECHCVPGYTGEQCQTNIDECDPSPCKNGAPCVDLVDEFNCLCTSGYRGKFVFISVSLNKTRVDQFIIKKNMYANAIKN